MVAPSQAPTVGSVPPSRAPGRGGHGQGGGGGGGGDFGGEAPMLGVLIPADGVARVIGKAGANLKAIRERTGARLQVQQDSAAAGSSVRRVDLIGQASNVGMAAGMVMVHASGVQSGEVEVMMHIPAALAGTVIGKGGDNLKDVRQKTGVRVKVERDPVSNPATGEEERRLSVSGDVSSFGNALSLALSGGRPSFGGMASAGAMAAMPAVAARVSSTIVGGSTMVARAAVGGGAPPMGPTDVRDMPDDPDAVQIHMGIHDKLVGAIVGKQGATIKHMEQQSGVLRLSVTNRSPGNSSRRIVCIGGMQQVQSAQQLVHNHALMSCEAAGVDSRDVMELSVTFWIPRDVCGAVIGKQGATLQSIREQAGVKVKLDRDEEKGMRPCQITGPQPSVMQAQGLIFNVIAQAQAEGGPTKRSAPGGDGGDDGSKRMRLSETSSQTKLLIPSRLAGAVIGKQGANLAKIREDFGIKVNMLSRDQAPNWMLDDRLVIITGSLESRTAAAVAVVSSALPEGEEGSIKMLVSQKEAGAIIGRSGSSLTAIREQTGVKIQVQKEEIQGERLVSASGSVRSLTSAVRLVVEAASNPGSAPTPGLND